MNQQATAIGNSTSSQSPREIAVRVAYTRLKYSKGSVLGGGYSVRAPAGGNWGTGRTANLIFGTEASAANQRIFGIHPVRHGADVEFFDVDRRILREFLEIVGRNGWWGRRINIWVEGMNGGRRDLVSRATPIKTPVEPVKLIGQDLAKHPKLIYPRNSEGKSEPGAGRSIGPNTLIGGKYYFVYGGQLETEARYRGFDCSSFVKMALKLPTTQLSDPLGKPLPLSGPNIAAATGMGLALESTSRTEVISFIQGSSTVNALSIIQRDRGKHGHCVLVVDGAVFEFNVPHARGLQPGYLKAADIQEKPGDHQSFDLYGGGYVTPIAKWRENDHDPATYRVFARQLVASSGNRNNAMGTMA